MLQEIKTENKNFPTTDFEKEFRTLDDTLEGGGRGFPRLPLSSVSKFGKCCADRIYFESTLNLLAIREPLDGGLSRF